MQAMKGYGRPSSGTNRHMASDIVEYCKKLAYQGEDLKAEAKIVDRVYGCCWNDDTSYLHTFGPETEEEEVEVDELADEEAKKHRGDPCAELDDDYEAPLEVKVSPVTHFNLLSLHCILHHVQQYRLDRCLEMLVQLPRERVVDIMWKLQDYSGPFLGKMPVFDLSDYLDTCSACSMDLVYEEWVIHQVYEGYRLDLLRTS